MFSAVNWSLVTELLMDFASAGLLLKVKPITFSLNTWFYMQPKRDCFTSKVNVVTVLILYVHHDL